jgi:glycosyltransferase involved in cell wall biosynthesis
LRLCLISTEIFAWGKHGGFGRATRLIGRELAQRGVEVFAVVPRRQDQQPVEKLDGITVIGFEATRPQAMTQIFKDINADIHHSCEASLGTWFAQRAMPHKKHMITFRDPRDWADWRMELARPSLNYLQVVGNWLFESGPLVASAIRKADAHFTIGEYLVGKVQKMYGLKGDVTFLPTPVTIPPEPVKAKTPTVCYLARMDRRKRPELFFELAEKFPNVHFLALGKSRDKRYDQALRDRYGKLRNLTMHGFVDQFSSDLHSRSLEESWVMVNTATREALPNAFIESCSHGCALLSAVDPDGLASKFGYAALEDDFERGLAWLLENDRWRARGAAARQHMQDVFSVDRAIDLHLEVYQRLLGQPIDRSRWERWSQFPGQIGGSNKLGSGFNYAANLIPSLPV